MSSSDMIDPSADVPDNSTDMGVYLNPYSNDTDPYYDNSTYNYNDGSIQSKGLFPISGSQRLFKSSSTALLAITFILFVGYAVVKFIANRKT